MYMLIVEIIKYAYYQLPKYSRLNNWLSSYNQLNHASFTDIVQQVYSNLSGNGTMLSLGQSRKPKGVG